MLVTHLLQHAVQDGCKNCGADLHLSYWAVTIRPHLSSIPVSSAVTCRQRETRCLKYTAASPHVSPPHRPATVSKALSSAECSKCSSSLESHEDGDDSWALPSPDRPIVWIKGFKPVVQTIVLNFFFNEYRSIFLLDLYFFFLPSSLWPFFVL